MHITKETFIPSRPRFPWVDYIESDVTPMLLKAGWLNTRRRVEKHLKLLDLVGRSIKARHQAPTS